MFGNLGIGEIVLIAGIALVVIGPDKFPEFAKVALRAFRDLRGYLDEVKKEINEELQPVKREIEDFASHNPEEYIDAMAGAVTGADEEGDYSEDEDEADGTDVAEAAPGEEPTDGDEPAKGEETAAPEPAGGDQSEEAADPGDAEGDAAPADPCGENQDDAVEAQD